MDLALTAEQQQYLASVDEFARVVVAHRAHDIDETGVFPLDLLHEAAVRGLLGVTIAQEWGGAGRDYVCYALAIEAVAKASATLAASLAVSNSLVAELIAHAGSAAQRQRWLRALTQGELIGAFALSEPGAGTDAANQQATAAEGAAGFHLVGQKVWVANAAAADLVVVFARTGPGPRGQDITAFLVPMDTPGITRVARADSLGVRGLGCMDLAFDVTLGADAVLGPRDQGFPLALWALEGGRVAIAAQALGIGQAALKEAIAHAKVREQFGRPIAGHEAVQWMIADMGTDLEAARLLTWQAAALKPHQASIAFEASMAKLAASTAARRATDHAMQILASAGYRRGSVVERLFRDARATEIYQGTSEAQRMVIAAHVLREG